MRRWPWAVSSKSSPVGLIPAQRPVILPCRNARGAVATRRTGAIGPGGHVLGRLRRVEPVLQAAEQGDQQGRQVLRRSAQLDEAHRAAADLFRRGGEGVVHVHPDADHRAAMARHFDQHPGQLARDHASTMRRRCCDPAAHGARCPLPGACQHVVGPLDAQRAAGQQGRDRLDHGDGGGQRGRRRAVWPIAQHWAGSTRLNVRLPGSDHQRLAPPRPAVC